MNIRQEEKKKDKEKEKSTNRQEELKTRVSNRPTFDT